MTTNKNFEEIYNAAEYVIDDGTRRFAIRVGEPSDELDSLLEENQCETWAFISAHNPRSQKITDEENNLRHAEFLSYLNQKEYLYFNAYGHSTDGSWSPEASVLIAGIDPAEAVGIGSKFDQSAILTGRKGSSPELVWCDQGES